MVYLDPVAVVAEGVPWWVILLAVLAGLLVLALLVLLLWKVRPRGGMEPEGTGIRGKGLAAHSHRFTQQLLPRALTVHAPGTLSALDGSELAPVQTLSSRLV